MEKTIEKYKKAITEEYQDVVKHRNTSTMFWIKEQPGSDGEYLMFRRKVFQDGVIEGIEIAVAMLLGQEAMEELFDIGEEGLVAV